MTGRARRLARDLRALGIAAPIRVGYEASKRSGFHSILFHALRRRPPELPTAVPIGNLETNSGAARTRTLEDAKAILRGGLRVFGRRTQTGVAEPWNRDPNTGRSWPTSTPWWRIDIRTDDRLGDVKFVWEAARHRDLVVLARAARIDPSGPWAATADRMLANWCEQNRPEHGVNWYSSLELSLRAIAWSQVLAIAGDRLRESTRREMADHLLASARHILVELPYTMSSMKNNHMLGDGLGLIVLSRLFPDHRGSRRWACIGNRIFSAQLDRHMRPDGSMIEDSLSYHRFVLEMLIVRVLLGGAPPQVGVAMRAASMHLAKIGVFDGDVPQYGDWDEGRVLASSGDPLDVAATTALGLSLAGEPVPAAWHDRYDELAWYGLADPKYGELDFGAWGAARVSGGIAYAREGPWRVWFKVGSGPSHGHADLTSVWVQHDGHWVIADPGTGTYNGPMDVRNGFRTSSAHPVLRVWNQDQLVPHRAFRWLHSATGHLAPVVRVRENVVMFGWHDAYERTALNLRVARAIVVDDTSVTVLDWLSSEGAATPWRLTIPLGASIVWAGGALTRSGQTLTSSGLDAASICSGQRAPFAGWTSPTYGQWQSTQWLELAGTSRVHAWQVGAGPKPKSNDNGEQVIGALRFQIGWAVDGAELEIHDVPAAAMTVMRA